MGALGSQSTPGPPEFKIFEICKIKFVKNLPPAQFLRREADVGGPFLLCFLHRLKWPPEATFPWRSSTILKRQNMTFHIKNNSVFTHHSSPKD